MGFWDTLSSFIPETESTKMYKAENALRMKALEREERQAAMEEENLLRQRNAQSAFMNRTAPTRTIANSVFDSGLPTDQLLAEAAPEQEFAARVASVRPKKFTGVVGANDVAYINNEVVARGPVSGGPGFKPTNMQIPGTDKVALARTQQDYDALADAGYVESGTSVPGAPKPMDKKSTPNDYMEDPINPGRRIMVPGGSAAVARAQALADPVLVERKAFNEAATQYGTMTDLMNDDSGASDISLVYTFFKAADPQSTVREGEFATVGEKMGLPSKIIGQLNSLSQGKGFLTPDVRKSLVDAAGRAVLQRKRGLQRSYKDASGGLEGLGVDRKAFLPFSVSDVNLAEVRREFPEAQQDTAGRVFVLKNGKRRYIELDE